MTDPRKLDEELSRVLETAKQTLDVPELQQLRQTQHSAWPWEVPQAPVYTSDHTPG